jgi:glycerophosphoryl diester phosphodiesterase
MFGGTQVWGHRGCRGPANPPENSVAAFQSAIEQGADGVELDLFLSKDERLVVFHDETLDRMTNGHGSITSFTLAELQGLRLADFNGGSSEAKIPTLDNVLDLVARYRYQSPRTSRGQDFVVNIELKGTGIPIFLAKCLEGRLQDGWSRHNFLVSSFDMNSLREMKRARTDIPLGALFESSAEPWDIEAGDLELGLAAIRDIHPITVNITLRSLTAETTKIIRRAGAVPMVWTSNEVDPDRLGAAERRRVAAQLLSNEIGAIITDFPEQMRRLLNGS